MRVYKTAGGKQMAGLMHSASDLKQQRIPTKFLIRPTVFYFTVFGAVFLFLLNIPFPVLAETLEIPGTGAAQVLLQKLADEFNKDYPDNTIIIPPSVGSSGGIRLVGEGKNILGRVARPIDYEEKKYGLTYQVFAKDPVLFAVSRKVGLQNLTREQLLRIFSGEVENWQEVGGKDFPIRLLVREPNDSSFLIIKQHIPEFRDIEFPERAKFLYHDSEMIEMLQKYSTVIGWLTGSSYNTIAHKVNSLSLDGVEPTAENILTGTYPLSGDYALVYNEKKLNDLAKEFIEFLSSEKASIIMKDEGVISILAR